MAKLYLATKEGIAGFRRAVAIKVVGELLADDPAFLKMFLDEARLAAQIRHPNVIYTEDLGEEGGRHYIVMECVHGGSVAELVASLRQLDLRMSPALAVSVIAAAAEGLHAAHDAHASDGTPFGIVHRDVSPQNILVSSEGAVKLIDFGVARADQRLHQTLDPSASMKGKLRYMPPEQLAADPALDRRADIFSLAVVLWEMLSGRRIFGQQTNDQVSAALREGRLPRLDAVSEGVPASLADAVARALAHDASERPATAREFRQSIVEAVPEAREVDAIERAAVVRAILAPELEARARRLSVFGAMGPNTRDLDRTSHDVLERWTLPLSNPTDHSPSAIRQQDAAPEGHDADDDPMPFKRHALLLLGLVLLTFLGLGALMWSRAGASRRAEPTLGPSPLTPLAASPWAGTQGQGSIQGSPRDGSLRKASSVRLSRNANRSARTSSVRSKPLTSGLLCG